MTLVRRLGAIGGLAALGVAGWELQRRRDLRAVESDPEWHELNRPLGGRSRTVRAQDGTGLHVETFGDEAAPVIVLVHGWTCSIELWHYQIRDLSRDFRVIAYDQRGHGRSAVPDDPESYSESVLADDLEAVLAACLPSRQRFVIAGHSMGGMTIIAWAGQHPDEVRRRVNAAALINTGVSEMVARLLVLGPLAGVRVHSAVVGPMQHLQARLPTRLTPVTLRLVRHVETGEAASPGRVALLHRMLVNCPAPVRAGYGRLLSRLDLTESVPQLTAPTLLIAGEQDRLLPPVHSRRLAEQLPDVIELVELPHVGHMSPIEAPEIVTEWLARLLGTISPFTPDGRNSANRPFERARRGAGGACRGVRG